MKIRNCTPTLGRWLQFHWLIGDNLFPHLWWLDGFTYPYESVRVRALQLPTSWAHGEGHVLLLFILRRGGNSCAALSCHRCCLATTIPCESIRAADLPLRGSTTTTKA